MILIIDNYDSFTYNIAQYIGEAGLQLQVVRSNQINFNKLLTVNPTHIILSPGPGHPEKCYSCIEIIQKYAGKIPILGICLGHQCIGYQFGANINKLDIPVHGKISYVYHNYAQIFNNLPNPFNATRYHSLIINNVIPNNLEITAWTHNGLIMACRHKQYHTLQGIQFHPESVWTEQGQTIINNFLYNT